MRPTLCPEERLSLCKLLLNRTLWEGCDPKVKATAVDAVFELCSFEHIRLDWLATVEKLCDLNKGELDYWAGLIKYRTKRDD